MRRYQVDSAQPSRAHTLLVMLVIAALSAVALLQFAHPTVRPSDAPLTVFSAVRARQDIAAIAHAPRPLGSPEHERVRDFLVGALRRMGLTTEIQQAIEVSQGPKNRNAATVQNIVGRLSGTASIRALMLVAHYDSVPTSPGASDNAAGIATILETLRAIRATGSLRNDLIVLFTDGEELGLLGSQAFVAQHRWADDVGAVLNFDARGSSGPSLMYQASAGGGWLIRALDQAAPAPSASSILAEFAKLAAGPSDFAVFDRAGISGLDFAYIGDWPNYHTLRDTLDTLDLRSVQQHGDTALALTCQLGQMDLRHAPAGDVVYFKLVGPWLVSYPVTWVIPLTIAVALLFISVALLGLRRHVLSVRGMLLGVLVFLGSTSAAAALALFGALILQLWRQGELIRPEGATPYQKLFAIGVVALAIAAVAAASLGLRHRLRLYDMMVGAWLWWLALLILTGLILPGGSYLFAWPLLVGLLGLGTIFAANDHLTRAGQLFALFCPAVPALLLLVPIMAILADALVLWEHLIIAVATALLAGLLLPLIPLLAPAKLWLLPEAAALVGIGAIAATGALAGYDMQHPRPNNIFYGLDADTGTAAWLSFDARPDDWTQQFFAEGVAVGNGRPFLAADSPPVLMAPAAALSLTPPTVAVLGSQAKADSRTVHLRVASTRGATALEVRAAHADAVLAAVVNGKPLAPNRGFGGRIVRYHNAPPQGIELTLTVRGDQVVELQVADIVDGLPAIPGRSFTPRPADATPYAPADYDLATLVVRSVTIAATGQTEHWPIGRTSATPVPDWGVTYGRAHQAD